MVCVGIKGRLSCWDDWNALVLVPYADYITVCQEADDDHSASNKESGLWYSLEESVAIPIYQQGSHLPLKNDLCCMI